MKISQSREPLVSVCIPAYNSEKTIAKTISSLIIQTYKNLEIIIIDNCSTDETVKIIKEFVDPRIKIIQNDEHLPAAENNWNRCFQFAKGEFMAIFHADDVYLPNMIFRQIEIFKKNPIVGGVFTEGDVIDEHDKVIDRLRLPPQISGDTPYTYRELLPIVLEQGDFFLCPSAMIKGDVYKKLAPFRYELFGSASDFDMWLRVAKTCPVIIIDEKLMKYRISRSQGSFILKSRTHEADGFRVLDFHTSEVGVHYDLSSDTLGRYELRRMEDQIFCALNYLKKHDFSGFRQNMEHMAWGKYIRIILVKPRISLPVLIRGFFKVLNNLIP